MSEGEASLSESPWRLEGAPKVDVLFLPSSALLPDTLQPQGQGCWPAHDALSKKGKKTEDLLFGEPLEMHRRLGVLLMEKEERDTTEHRNYIHVFVLMQSARIGTCTQKRSFAREFIIVRFFCPAFWS